MTRYAVLSMDLEDWYHLDYFQGIAPDRSASMLDGLDVYLSLLERHSIRTTFFVLSELAAGLGDKLRNMAEAGHEIASHGEAHKRPLQMTIDEFAADLRQSKATLENVVQRPVSRRADPDRCLIRRLVVGVGDPNPHRDSLRGIQEPLHP